ncbi:hypothetical protein BTI_2429 [Burkholderia thailandensis MSMB121]|nr:hypothetical protein BTI_2429 [Burkholderia thailandensis MSMB121]
MIYRAERGILSRVSLFPVCSKSTLAKLKPRVLKSSSLSIALCALLLAACSSASDISATETPNVYTVDSNSRGILLSWAGAHERAVNEATNYCAQRGMQASVKRESVDRGSGSQGRAQLAFECHPAF